MKIFALATAVSAKNLKRTEFPGAGTIDVQGAFSADQSSDQGQVPQVSFQKPQCCRHLKWSKHNGKKINIWVHQMGTFKQMPFYKGTISKKESEKIGLPHAEDAEEDAKEDVFIWMTYQGPADRWFGNVNTAHWVISKELGDYGNSNPGNQLISDHGGLVGPTKPMCLDEADVWKNQFKCEHPPWGRDGLPKEPIGEELENDSHRFEDLSCATASERKEWGLFWDDNPINTCNIGNLLEVKGRKQIKRAINYIDASQFASQEPKLRKAYKTIVDKWRVLTGMAESGIPDYPWLDCGFNEEKKEFTKRLSPSRGSIDEEKCSYKLREENRQYLCQAGSGYIDKCDAICPTLNAVDSFGQKSNRENAILLIEKHLDTILFLTEDYFTKHHKNEYAEGWKINGCQQVQTDFGQKLLNNDGVTCKPTDYCGQRIREIYNATNVFNEFFETIGERRIVKLSDFEDDWKKDKRFY